MHKPVCHQRSIMGCCCSHAIFHLLKRVAWIEKARKPQGEDAAETYLQNKHIGVVVFDEELHVVFHSLFSA